METGRPLSVLDYWRIVWRARWLIWGMVAVASVAAFGYARTMPKIYTARATILLPRDAPSSFSTSIGAMLMGGGGGGREGGSGLFSLPNVTFGTGSMSTDEDRFLAMLRSATLRREVVAELARTRGVGVGSHLLSVTADNKEKGVIAVNVQATDPHVAADVANQYFVTLDAMLQRFGEQSVKRKETLYTAQLERAAQGVETAEHALLKFQSANRFIPIDAPTKAGVEAVASLRGMILGLELQREVLRLRVTDEHPQMRELQKQIAELKRQYSKNLFGEPMDLPAESPAARGGRKEFFVPASRMTPVQFAFLKLFRDLKIQEAFYTAALQGLQQIKYGDGMQQVAVKVLDPAGPASEPVGPNIGKIVLVAAASALIAGILLVFALEYLRLIRQEERQPGAAGVRTEPATNGAGVARPHAPERVRGTEPEPVRARRGRVTTTERME